MLLAALLLLVNAPVAVIEPRSAFAPGPGWPGTPWMPWMPWSPLAPLAPCFASTAQFAEGGLLFAFAARATYEEPFSETASSTAYAVALLQAPRQLRPWSFQFRGCSEPV